MRGSRRQPRGLPWPVEARPRIPFFRAIYLSFRMFSFVIKARTARSRASGPAVAVPRDGTGRGRQGGRLVLQRLTTFPTKSGVFHFEIATVSALHLDDFLRRRRTDPRWVGRAAGRRKGLLHVRLDHVGRHPRPASHRAARPAHHRGHEGAAEHRPAEPDQSEAESPHGEGEVPAPRAEEPSDIPAIRRRGRAHIGVELPRDTGRIAEDDEASPRSGPVRARSSCRDGPTVVASGALFPRTRRAPPAPAPTTLRRVGTKPIRELTAEATRLTRASATVRSRSPPRRSSLGCTPALSRTPFLCQSHSSSSRRTAKPGRRACRS